MQCTDRLLEGNVQVGRRVKDPRCDADGSVLVCALNIELFVLAAIRVTSGLEHR